MLTKNYTKLDLTASTSLYNSNNGGSDIKKQLADGLKYCHTRINANTSKTLETSAFLYALIEILNEKSLISIEELLEKNPEGKNIRVFY